MSIRILGALILSAYGIAINFSTVAANPVPPKGLLESMQEVSKTTNPDDLHAAVADMQYKSAMCTAFYTLAYQGAVQAGIKSSDLTSMKAATDQSMQLTFTLAQHINMTEQALESQSKLNLETLLDAMNHSWDNTPTIVEKYGIPCKDFMENPLVSWAHWLKIERENGDRARRGS